MTLKEIAQSVVSLDPDKMTCKGSIKKTQLIVSHDDHPGEIKHLLSPSYQQKILDNSFTENDLEGVLEEAKSFIRYGV